MLQKLNSLLGEQQKNTGEANRGKQQDHTGQNSVPGSISWGFPGIGWLYQFLKTGSQIPGCLQGNERKVLNHTHGPET